MNKGQLREDLIEIVACNLEMHIQTMEEGLIPPATDCSKWRSKYNTPILPPPYMILNTFKNEVDFTVGLILTAVDRSLKE